MSAQEKPARPLQKDRFGGAAGSHVPKRSPFRKRLASIALALGVTVLAAAGCGGVAKGAIATVGGVPISTAQFEQYLRQLGGETGQSALPSPGTSAYRQETVEAVSALVQQQVLLNAASRLKISVTSQRVQGQLEQMAAGYGGMQKLYAAAQRAGMNSAQLTTYIKDSLLGQGVYRQMSAKFAPTAALMLSYYKTHKAQFAQPTTRTVRHILVKTKAEALAVRALLVVDPSNANWAKLARRYSIDPGSKNSGGNLGAIKPGQMVKPFDRAAFSLPIDKISQPVHSQYGWHILEVTAITPAKVTTFTAAKVTIRNTLVAQKWQYWLTWTQKGTTVIYAPGFDPAQLTASPSPSPSPSPSSSK